MVMAQCPLEPIHKTITSQFVSSPKAGVYQSAQGPEWACERLQSDALHGFRKCKEQKYKKCLQAYSFISFMAFSTDKALPRDKSE